MDAYKQTERNEPHYNTGMSTEHLEERLSPRVVFFSMSPEISGDCEKHHGVAQLHKNHSRQFNLNYQMATTHAEHECLKKTNVRAKKLTTPAWANTVGSPKAETIIPAVKKRANSMHALVPKFKILIISRHIIGIIDRFIFRSFKISRLNKNKIVSFNVSIEYLKVYNIPVISS